MSEKFKYAPGKPGFGTKGDKGDDGQQGLSIYFTNIRPTTQQALLKNRIQNNNTLWTDELSVKPLPNGRVYVNGDLVIDAEGKAYTINADLGTLEPISATLNMGGFFVPLGYTTDKGFDRYLNSNTEPKYIIDNVYMHQGAGDYTKVPSDIYNITPSNFTRIEYTNVPQNNKRAFTVYSAGDPEGYMSVESSKSLALIFNDNTSTFHLGNLDNNDNLRNTNLTFDVASLRQNKQPNSYLSTTSELGTILTNFEINANELFDGAFNSSPTSFEGNIGVNDISIAWNLNDFCPGGNVSGDLYIYRYLYGYNNKIFSMDSSILRPLILHDIDTIGNVVINNIDTDDSYSCYIKVHKNGWCRKSKNVNLFKGQLDVQPTQILNIPNNDASVHSFAVTADNIWDVTFSDDSWITNLQCTSIGGHDGSINFNVTTNSGILRTTTMTVTLFGGLNQIIPISQYGIADDWTIDLNILAGSDPKNVILYVHHIPDGTSVDISISSTVNAYVNVEDVDQGQIDAFATTFVGNTTLASTTAQISGLGYDSQSDTITYGINNITKSSSIEFKFAGTFYEDTQYIDRITDGSIYITACKISGTGVDASLINNAITWNNQHSVSVTKI